MRLPALLLALCLVLTACSGRLTPLPTGNAPVDRVLWVKPYLVRTVQALVPLKTADDIAFVVIVPLRDPGDGLYRPIALGTGKLLEPVDDWQSYPRWGEFVNAYGYPTETAFERPIPLSGLRVHGRYRIVALAFDKDYHLISKPDASSVDLTLTDDDRPIAESPLPLRIMDTPFGATANLQLSVTGDVDRLESLVVSLYRALEGQDTGHLVATFEVPANQVPGPLRLSHLQADGRYTVVVEARPTAGEAPEPSVWEFEVGLDDVVPSHTIAIALP